MSSRRSWRNCLLRKEPDCSTICKVNALSKTDSVALRQRLAGLSAGQRAKLVRRLGEVKSGAASSGGSPAISKARPLRVEEHPRVAVYPASRGQRRMWFLHHYAPESPVYCSPSALDRKSTRLNSSHVDILYGFFCL